MDKQRFDWIVDSLNDDKLTVWEAGFVEKCILGWEKYGKLTPAMEKKLEEIYKEKSK